MDQHTHHEGHGTDEHTGDKKHDGHSHHRHRSPSVVGDEHSEHGRHQGGGHPKSQPGNSDRAAHEHHRSGGDLSSHAGHTDHSGHESMFRNRFWVSLFLSIPVLLYSPTVQEWLNYSARSFSGSDWVPIVFSVVIFAYGGVPFLSMAIPEIRNKAPGMMTLISMAISVAFVYSVTDFAFDLGEGFFWELVTLIDIMLLGHWLEMRSVRQASGALNELANLMPDEAELLLPDGSTQRVAVASLSNGDSVLIRPGSSIPADGEVVSGESEVNESLVTGESHPVFKSAGDEVIAGAVNGDGSIRVSVSAVGDETALAGIMKLVSEAQASKSRTQLLADRAAGWLFYAAIGVATVTAVAWTIASGFNVETLSRVVTVLVIACPHALGLAIPLVVAISTTVSARNGLLVRDRLALEEARNIDTVVFDKTGTLTEGSLGVNNIRSFGALDEDGVLAITAALEGDSEHLIAKAVREEAESRDLSIPSVSKFIAIKGRGVEAEIGGVVYQVGGPRMLELQHTEIPGEVEDFHALEGGLGRTVIYLLRDSEIVAAFSLSDVVRDESLAAVQQLQGMGVEVAMLTGDSKSVAATVAEELGIETYFAEVLPEHKEQKIAELQADGRRVAMVGDGINDSPALARADIGIAIGSGTNVAIESAGIVLVRNNPLDIGKIVNLSRASYRKMKQNLIWATGYNIVALPLAAGIAAPFGFVPSPALGAVFMSLSTIVVALNAQLLRRVEN